MLYQCLQTWYSYVPVYHRGDSKREYEILHVLRTGLRIAKQPEPGRCLHFLHPWTQLAKGSTSAPFVCWDAFEGWESWFATAELFLELPPQLVLMNFLWWCCQASRPDWDLCHRLSNKSLSWSLNQSGKASEHHKLSAKLFPISYACLCCQSCKKQPFPFFQGKV